MAHTPAVRSSDIKYLSCPFLYYLIRRLGITSIFKTSEAFSHGDWVHIRAACKPKDDPEKYMSERFKEWTARVSAAALAVGMGEGSLLPFIDNELIRFKEAMAWWDGWMNVRCAGLKQGFEALYDPDVWQVLGSEVLLAMPASSKDTKIVIQTDKLVLHKPTYSVWVDDFKTEAGSCVDRSRICTNEHQTRTYILTAHNCLGRIGEYYGLDLDRLSFGGMRHIILHKPSIRFGMNDRDYRWVAEGKKSGLSGAIYVERMSKRWTGEITGTMDTLSNASEEEAIKWLHSKTGKKPEKQYQLEPDINNYRRRVGSYLNAEGEYAHKSVDYMTDPPILVSKTAGFLDQDAEKECRSILHTLTRMATLAGPCPNDYPRTAEGMTMGNGSKKPSPYAEFFDMPVVEWPNIMKRNLLVVDHRDKTEWLDSEFQIL